MTVSHLMHVSPGFCCMQMAQTEFVRMNVEHTKGVMLSIQVKYLIAQGSYELGSYTQNS